MYTVCIYIYVCIVNKLRAVVACLLSRAVPYPPLSTTETKNSAELQLSPYTEKMCKIQFWHYLYCRWKRIGNNYTNGCGNTIPESANFFGRVFNFHMTISGKGVVMLVLTSAKHRSSRCIFSSRVAHSQFHASPWQCYILRKPRRQIFSQNNLTKIKHSLFNG